jgi:two-component sensor histidine kinase
MVKLVTKNDIRIYHTENGLTSNKIRFLRPLTKDLLLAGTENGMQLYNKIVGTFSSVISQPNFISAGFVENSSPLLFYNVNHRFGKYDSTNRRIVNYNLPGPANAKVYCSIKDANGIIFNGTEKGLIIYTSTKSYYDSQIPYAIFDLLIDKKGYLWVATRDNGLYRIHYSNSNNKINLVIKNFSDLLPDKHTYRIFEDSKSNIWVGTRFQGIAQLKNKGNDEYTVQHFDLEHGLMSNWITAIAEDDAGYIWIGSSLGIDKLVPADTSFHIFNFSRINNYFANINAILPENDHSLWFATNSGLVHINQDETEKTPPSPAYITSVALGDTTFNFSKHHANTKVYLKYNQNRAGFDFSSPSFINEKQILYSYRLLGTQDTTWKKPGNVHNVSYASLQPGHYRFEVKTIGWNGEWGGPANFEFIIRPPYWQTWWFYSLVSLIVLILFYAFYRYRIRQFVRLQKVRNRIASDLHDDIGSTLTNINMLSEISRKNLKEPREAEKFLHRITEEVTATSQALNDIIWSVNTRNDSMEETMSRMRRYAAELFDDSSTNCHLDLDENVAGRKLNMEARRDVYLIYKESMNNIVKHASAKNVWIDAKWRNGKLQLNVKDDGKGFDDSVVTNRNGLKNIRSRTEKWKGTASIKTAPGSGTLIEIIIPLAE